MDSSFYGGLPGFSFIIVKSFASEAEMIAAFKQGPDYTTVHYEEHVLINTENKNDSTNGNVYRRGYDYTNDLGGAIYVGTIVGPAGKAPMLEMTTIQDVKNKQAEEEYDYRYTEGSYAPTTNLVPGKDGDTYNDSIDWACCSIRDENGEDTIAYIGFKFPYLIVDYTAESVSPYYNRSNSTEDFINQNLVDRTDDETHPYYEKWNLSIPKGIKGDSFKNFKVMTAASNIYAYNFSTHTKSDYSGKADDINNGRKVLVYEYYHYDKLEGGEPVYIYLGDYNMVEDITLQDNGTVVITYTHEDDYTYEQALKWIKQVELTEEGHLTVTYNNTNTDGSNVTYEADLAWVKDIKLSENGKITLNFTGNKKDEVLSQELQWVNKIEIAEDGTVTFTYNTLDSSGNYKTEVFDKKLQYISNVSIQTADDTGVEGTGDQKVHVTYNTGAEEILGEPLNYIMEMAINPENYHYLVYYSDPVRRQALIDAGVSVIYKDKDGWLDLGSTKDENGILVGLNLSSDTSSGITDIATAIEYLNATYPTGLTGIDLRGKVVTIGDSLSDKKFYAFDYTIENAAYKGWFYLGSFEIETDNIFIIAKESDSDIETKKSNLTVGGLWFVVEEEE